MQRKRNFKPLGSTHIDGGAINPFGVPVNKLTPSELATIVKEELPAVLREMSEEELARLRAMSGTELGRAALLAVVEKFVKEMLDEKVTSGELVRLENGNYMKRAEWEARNSQPTA